MDHRSKDAFMATVSHELRNPLNAMLGLAQLLDASELTAVQRSQARTLLEAGRALRVILDDILVITEPESRNREENTDCDPTLAARAVSHLMQPIAWQRQLELTVTSARDVPMVAVDSHRVRHALFKLVDNALKYTISGKIEIRAEAIHHHNTPFVRFSVKDTGPGIPPEIQGSLFNAPPPRSRYVRRSHGLGYGLIIVRQITEAAGGLYGFDSHLGEGSTFWFTLPAIGQNSSAGALAFDVQPHPPEGKHLLIYAGDGNADQTLENFLTPFHNQLCFADIPSDLVSMAARTRYDAAIVRVDYADMLASAPGVSLPILALIPQELANVHSTAASVSRNWPCPAAELYAALAQIRLSEQNRKNKRNHPPPADVIDHATITALEKSVGEETLIEIFRAFLDNTAKIHDQLSGLLQGGDLSQAEGMARDIIGSASGLGFDAITVSARRLTAAIREEAGEAQLREKIATLIKDGDRTQNALQGLYPELIR